MNYSCIAVLLLAVVCVLGKEFCEVGDRNWKLLDGPPWNARKNGSTKTYQISLCHPLVYDSFPGKDCNDSAVCAFENGTAQSIANYSTANVNLKIIGYVGDFCGKSFNHRTTFHFTCGKHLNFPGITLEDRCYTLFSWTSLAACEEASSRKEVACYVYDDDGNLKDLTPLIKTKGGHSVVSTDLGVDFFINVCSDIIPDGATEGCPKGAAACRKIGSEILSFGTPVTPVFSSGSSLKIIYSSNNATVPAGCDMQPRTTITFKCPPKGRSRRPRLIDSSNCQYEIEWQTEHSCPQNLVTTDLKSCKFTREEHHVHLDLSPLKKKDDGYTVHVHNSTQNRTFFLNVCGGLGIRSCSRIWKSASVCMNDVPIGYVGPDSSLSYLDGKVKLIYQGKEFCSNKSQILYRTIIEFQCDPNAGAGTPTFVGEIDCDFIFNWATSHACPNHPLSDSCYIEDKNIHIDLGLLIQNPDQEPWQVVNSIKANNSVYYLNVCGGITKNFKGSNCSSSAAVCKIGSNGTSFNYGKFTSPPTYNRDSKIVTLVYTEGDSCGKGQRKTHISLICKPGVLNSPPVLESVSDDDCHAVIQWHTAAACPQATVKGSDCKLVNKDLGLAFDLNPLKKDNYYEVKTDNYTYYLNVCGQVIGTKCDETPNNLNAAACREGATAVKIGEPSSELLYADGMIKLTYSLGAPYNGSQKVRHRTTITFLCDEKAGLGNPEFHKEVGPAHTFLWYTSHACPRNSFGCFVRDPHSNKQYDLSRLTRAAGEQNWVMSEKTGNQTKKFYLNICRPLVDTGTPCPSSSSACLVESNQISGTEDVINIGEVTQPPEVKSNGLIQLEYKNGGPCIEYGKNTTYSTLIHFICGKYNDEHFRFLNKVGQCQYMFLMQSSAACPIEEEKSENDCSIKDPTTGTMYNFTQLKEKYYNVTAGNDRFQVTICGAKSGGCLSGNATNVTVCEVDEKGEVKKNIGFLNGYSLKILDSVITLVYNGTYNESTGTTSKVYITFKCSKQLGDNLTLQYVDSHAYYFDLSTPAACPSDHADCLFLDSDGNEYDLTPLIKRGSLNWEAADGRKGYTDHRYHINFCMPLNPSSQYKCPAGAVGACQTSKSTDQGLSLGVAIRPVVKGNNIVISYIGGALCNNGMHNHSAKVVLHCSEKQSELILLGESDSCMYYFYMYTPVACPLKEYVGNDCKVSVPGYNYHFDLSRLRQTTADHYKVTHGQYVYLLNVCGPVASGFSSCLEAGVCQTKVSNNEFAVDAGKANSKLHYKDGAVELRYEDGKGNCHGKYNRTSVIAFVCNPSGAEENAVSFFSEDDECTYTFKWQTSLVCLEHEVQECSVISDTNHYDLSSLSSDTYTIPFEEKDISISVCNRLSQSKYSKVCSLNSAACIVEYDKNNTIIKGTNIGDIGTPYVENGVLKLRYRHGDICNQDKTKRLQTIIEFECNANAPLATKPTYVGNENCTYFFLWIHPAACAIKEELSMDNCTAVNPVTGFMFDLSPLRSETFYRVKEGNHEYRINVCGNVRNTTCKNGSGSCQQEKNGSRSWNSGDSNLRLYYHNGVLMLNYTGGDICHKVHKRSTVIQFTCGHGAGHPTFISESDNCTYYFLWPTVYACEDRVPCSIANGSEIYDLTSLTLDNGYHTAVNLIDNGKYIINVCSPLNNPDPLCHDAGVCHVGTSAVSLGSPHGPPFFDFLGHVTLLYTDGAPCRTSDGKNSTNKARIVFLCGHEAGRGEPSLSSKDEDNCLYVFTWKTSLVCQEKKPSPPPPIACKYIDTNKGINIDLSPLRKSNSSYEVTGKRGDEKFTINICGPSEPGDSECSTAGVCFHGMAEKENFGSVNNATFSYSSKELTLTYDNGGSCPLSGTGMRSSHILFTCAKNAGNGFPILHKKSACLATFKWATNLVCVEEPPACTFRKGNNSYDLRLLSSISHSWNISDTNGNTYWINVCKQTNADFGPGKCVHSGVCMKFDNGTFLSVGDLYKWNLDATDSGEVILTYEYASEPCPGKVGTSTVKFICGKKMGAPKFKSGSLASCKFEFEWESTEACTAVRKESLQFINKAIYDPRLQKYFNISALYDSSPFTTEPSGKDGYVFVINFNGVGSFGSKKDCDNAAVCQTKPGTNFYRDIGSISSEAFFLKGNELILEIKSSGRKCGKNTNKNVTSVINFSCSTAAGVGSPIFYYESGNCDYLFNWDTALVCPKSPGTPDPVTTAKAESKKSEDHSKPEKASASYAVKIVVGIIVSASLIALIVVLAKEERRIAIKRKIRNLYLNVRLPKMFYRRDYSEAMLLSSPSIPPNSDSDVEILT